jgi:hypothetical protein
MDPMFEADRAKFARLAEASPHNPQWDKYNALITEATITNEYKLLGDGMDNVQRQQEELTMAAMRNCPLFPSSCMHIPPSLIPLESV